MSRLEELIAELCPDGVEYKTLGEIGTMIRGNGLQKKDFTESGVGCIHYGQIYTYYGLFTDKTKSFVSPELAEKLQKVQKGDIILAVTSENIEDVCKCVAWLGDEEIVTGGHSAIFKHQQNPKYIAYWLQSEEFAAQKIKIAQGTKVIDVTTKKLDGIKIPLPPLEIQSEIVRILDAFCELKTELKAELKAREVQFQEYLKKEYDFDSSIPIVSINDVCKKISSGGTPTSTNKDYYGGNIPWLRTQEIDWKYIYETSEKITDEGLKNSSANWIPENCVIVAIYGATAAKTAINKIPLTTNQACCNLQIDDTKALYKYVYYWLCKEYLNLKALGQGSQHNLNAGQIKSYKIPLPTLDKQKQIVCKLDNFHKLCSSITSGLPAEIAAREKQYEYYRDLLLTFKPKVTE